MRRLFVAVACLLYLTAVRAEDAKPKKIVLIAGPKSHGPVGNGIHDYGWSVQLLKVMLETSNVKDKVRVEIHLDGWPRDPKTLEDADALMIISDGRDGDQYAEAPHLASEDRVRFIEKQLRRGCGFLTFHFSTFAPQKYARQMLDWTGGYFQWETDGKRQWYSAITTTEAEVRPGSPDHPVSRGLKPFKLREEFYYNLRLNDKDTRRIWLVPALSGREPDGKVVAWARERPDGGRGFGTTAGHFYDNWKHEQFRKLILNALVWCAKAEVPPGGVESRFFTHDEIAKYLNPVLTDGRFGLGFDTHGRAAFLAGRGEYRDPPLTAECWAKLTGKQYHILIANEPKSSATHWEMFAEAGNGCYTVYLPGYTPDHVRSKVDVTDGRWHHFAFLFDRERVRLVLNGKLVADEPVKFNLGKTVEGRLAIGALAGKELGCGGVIDEVRISRGIREPLLVPATPYAPDGSTIGLWHLDRVDNGRFADESWHRNSATIEELQPTAAVGPRSPVGVDLDPGDRNLHLTLIDRSPDDAYMGVKADTQGQLFVGGREKLFVFEPDGQGGFRPRRELVRFPPDSIILGLEVRGNDLYVLTANALYLIPDGRTRREGLTPKRLVWGLPLDLHVSFHCLAWGPEGDLYFNHGDPLLNYGDWQRPDHWGHWTLYCQPEGTKVPYTGTGAVLRVRPDGSGLRVVATGLRGPVGLAFDPDWNLFTNDNDHESIPDRYGYVRLLHVTPQIDFAWPRGWMASKSPDRSDLVEPMISTLGRGVPVGLAWYDNGLIQARWDRGSIMRYPLRHRGATFSAEEEPFLTGQPPLRPTGLTVGNGRIFATVHYLAGNVGTPHCISDLVMVSAPDAAPEPIDLAAASDEKLWAELANRPLDRRQAAHQEIMRRGGSLLIEAANRWLSEGSANSQHLPWLAAASGSLRVTRRLIALAGGENRASRAQALRVMAAFPAVNAPPELFAAALKDADPRMQLAALHGYFDRDWPLPLDDVAKLASGPDLYVRQTAAKLLARRATLAQLEALASTPRADVRLAGVLAAGFRLTVPPADFVPPEAIKLQYSAGNAFFKLNYVGESQPVDLRALGRVGSFTTAEWWEVVKDRSEPRRLKDLLLAGLDSRPDGVVSQAEYHLSLLHDEAVETPLQLRASRRRQARVAALNHTQNFNRAWVLGPVQRNGPRESGDRFPEDGPIELSAAYGRNKSQVRWSETNLKDAGLNLQLRNEGPIAYIYFRLQSRRRQTIVLPDFSTDIWHNGVKVPIRTDIGMDLDLQPGSNDIVLTTTYVPEAFRILVEEEVVFVLPDRLDGAELAKRLREASRPGAGERVPPEFLNLDWVVEMKKGNAANGRRLFGSLACAKCHAIAADQPGGGAPSLADANRRFTVEHVVESILLPSRQVAEPFRGTRVDLRSGQTLTGLVVAESAADIELLLPDGSRKKIAKKEIEERTVAATSPMPAGLVKTPTELRDLLAFLLSDHPAPP